MIACICLCTPGLHDSLLNPLLLSTDGKVNLNPSCMRIFILTVSLFGVISGVYCECRLTCHCVWRCVTVLEYILVRCESVCGCINVCRAPPASLQAELASGRIRAAESSCTLQDASRAAAPGTRAALSISWLAGRCWALQLHACVPLPLGAIRHTDKHSERERERERAGGGARDGKSGIIIGDGVGEQCVWWLNNKCGISGFVWSQDWSPLLWWCWGERGGCRDFTHGPTIHPEIKSGTEVSLFNRLVVRH